MPRTKVTTKRLRGHTHHGVVDSAVTGAATASSANTAPGAMSRKPDISMRIIQTEMIKRILDASLMV
jgi:hypothetical protein